MTRDEMEKAASNPELQKHYEEVAAEDAPKPRKHGVGMPATLYLYQFASHVLDAMEHRQWRDVDVRLMLTDEEYAAQGFGDPERATYNAKWVALTMAFSELGRRITGLPIDFQIDQQTYANAKHKGKPRSYLGLVAHRFAEEGAA